MAFLYNAGQLSTIITKLSEMDVGDLGNSQENQNTYIYLYVNMAMRELVELANNVKYSDALFISSDGYKTFLAGNVAITDMFRPIKMYNAVESEVQERTSYSAPVGWIKESNNLEIHVRGIATGNYTLKYIKYPAAVTLDSDTVEFPPECISALSKAVVSLIKYSKNSYGGAEFASNQAKESLNIASKNTRKMV